MKKTIGLLFLLATASLAADVHFAWLPLSSNILGAPQTSTAATQYGVNVMIDSDNPKVTDFRVSIVVRMADDSIRTLSGTVARSRKGGGVMYSTLYSTWVGSDPNFEVLAIDVKAISAVSVTRPAAGRDYGAEQ